LLKTGRRFVGCGRGSPAATLIVFLSQVAQGSDNAVGGSGGMGRLRFRTFSRAGRLSAAGTRATGHGLASGS